MNLEESLRLASRPAPKFVEDSGVFNYYPSPTVSRFMLDEHFVRIVLGPVGSGKSLGCIMELMRRAGEQAPGPDGIRRTRFAIVRNTLPQLKTTALKDIQEILGHIIDYRVSESTIYIRQGDIQTEWLLIPLDSPEDQKRLLSTQLTGAWVNEICEVSVELIVALCGRLGRYPSAAMGGPTWHGLIGDSNFPSEDSEWYEALELDRAPTWNVFKQPSGLSDAAENVENLPDLYYENLIQKNKPEWIERYVLAKYGRSLSGQAVFRTSFIPERHISEKELMLTPGHTLIIGMDFGRTPTAVFTQPTHRGRLIVVDELTREGMGLRQFLREHLRPHLMKPRYVNQSVLIVGDPSGEIQSQWSEESAFSVLADEHFKALAAPTNDVDQRLRAVEKLLLENRGDMSALVIDKTHCPLLVRAMRQNYRYKLKKTGDTEDRPEKNHPWSDLADALQYACLAWGSGTAGRVLFRKAVQHKPTPPTSAWT